MKHYHLSPRVHVEAFGDEAILFIADREVMITVNRAAAEIFKAFRASRGQQPFTRADCVEFLLDSYDLSKAEAEIEAAGLLGFGLRNQIVHRGIPN